jgi:hypothetical protein
MAKWRESSCSIEYANIPHLVLEKFSSMGNGYTFEMESLIFYALAKATILFNHHDRVILDPALFNNDDRKILVFGDDVIMPSSKADVFIEVCEYLGMTVNRGKSFFSGPFRESCGGDYFNGIAIRPFYIKQTLNSAVLTNFINHCYGADINVMPQTLRDLLIKELPENHRIFGPVNYGDGYIHDTTYMCVAQKYTDADTTKMLQDIKNNSRYTFDAFQKNTKKDKRVFDVAERTYPYYKAMFYNMSQVAQRGSTKELRATESASKIKITVLSPYGEHNISERKALKIANDGLTHRADAHWCVAQDHSIVCYNEEDVYRFPFYWLIPKEKFLRYISSYVFYRLLYRGLTV